MAREHLMLSTRVCHMQFVIHIRSLRLGLCSIYCRIRYDLCGISSGGLELEVISSSCKKF